MLCTIVGYEFQYSGKKAADEAYAQSGQYCQNQPFNKNHLRPCPMLENPEILQKMVKETGAKSTDLQSPETAEHLCSKCVPYANAWKPYADKIWSETPVKKSSYENYGHC